MNICIKCRYISRLCHRTGSYSPASHRGGPGSISARTCWIFGSQVGLAMLFLQVLQFSPVSVILSMLCTHLYSNTNSYYVDKWAKPVKLQNNSFSDIRDHWTEECSLVVLQTSKR